MFPVPPRSLPYGSQSGIIQLWRNTSIIAIIDCFPSDSNDVRLHPEIIVERIHPFILALGHGAQAIVQGQGPVTEFVEDSLKEDYAGEGSGFEDIQLSQLLALRGMRYAVQKNVRVGDNVMSLWEQRMLWAWRRK